jgi:AcrR family transcriptional regulator
MDVSPPSDAPARGRPRSVASQEAIRRAAFALLIERGYPAMSIEAVAARAGTGKTTVYRWWPSRAELAVDAFFSETRAELQLADSCSAREDFGRQITDLANLLRGKRGRALAAMLGGALSDSELADALNRQWLQPRRQWGFERMSRAVADRQCRPGLDIAAALGILYGPVYTPLLFGESVPSRTQIRAHLDIAFTGIFRPDV